MSQEFQREDRYIVIKRKDLEKVPASYRKDLVDPLPWLQVHLPHREYLVIESDWPEYEQAWAMIEARITGTPTNFIACNVDESCGAVALAGGVQFVGYPPVPEDRKLAPPAGGQVEVLASFGSHVEDGMEVFNVHIGEGQSVGMVDRAHVTAAHERIKELEAALYKAAVIVRRHVTSNWSADVRDQVDAALSKGEPK
jgi:hypothetical protein